MEVGCDLSGLDLDQLKQLNEFPIGSWPPLCLLVLVCSQIMGKLCQYRCYPSIAEQGQQILSVLLLLSVGKP